MASKHGAIPPRDRTATETKNDIQQQLESDQLEECFSKQRIDEVEDSTWGRGYQITLKKEEQSIKVRVFPASRVMIVHVATARIQIGPITKVLRLPGWLGIIHETPTKLITLEIHATGRVEYGVTPLVHN
jgi:hypothetical protein